VVSLREICRGKGINLGEIWVSFWMSGERRLEREKEEKKFCCFPQMECGLHRIFDVLPSFLSC